MVVVHYLGILPCSENKLDNHCLDTEARDMRHREELPIDWAVAVAVAVEEEWHWLSFEPAFAATQYLRE